MTLVTILLVTTSIRMARANEVYPAFPTGTLTATATAVQTGTIATLTWNFHLPEGHAIDDYTMIIRQTQHPSAVIIDSSVSQSGQTLSLLPVDPGGSTFEFWSIHTPTLIATLLDTASILTPVRTATLSISSADPYPILPRTRADEPFNVQVTVNGLATEEYYPDEHKSVDLFHYSQSYSSSGNGNSIDRSLANQESVTNISQNGTQQLVIASPSVSATPADKARGEERFTIYSKADYQNPALILDTQFIQIWPVADGSISGITEGATVGADAPNVTITLNDLYPSSTTYAILYPGSPVANPSGRTVPSSQVVIHAAEPMNAEVVLSNYAHLIDSNGTWTLDVLTDTPFGTDRIIARSFNVEGLITPDIWRQAHFSSPDNTGDGADDFDFDSDGLSNIIEYAMGLNPTQKDFSKNPAIRLVGSNAEMSFNRPLSTRGITIGAEWSETLGNDWQPIPNTGTFPNCLFQKQINSIPKGFMRIIVSSFP